MTSSAESKNSFIFHFSLPSSQSTSEAQLRRMVLIFFNNFLWEEKDKWFLDHSATVHKSTHTHTAVATLFLSLLRLSAGNGNDYTQMDTLYLLFGKTMLLTEHNRERVDKLCSTSTSPDCSFSQEQEPKGVGTSVFIDYLELAEKLEADRMSLPIVWLLLLRSLLVCFNLSCSCCWLRFITGWEIGRRIVW